MSEFTLLHLPLSEDHLVNRLDDLCSRHIPVMSPEQVGQILEAIYLKMLDVAQGLEEQEMDTTFAVNACNKLAEASYWVSQFDG